MAKKATKAKKSRKAKQPVKSRKAGKPLQVRKRIARKPAARKRVARKRPAPRRKPAARARPAAKRGAGLLQKLVETIAPPADAGLRQFFEQGPKQDGRAPRAPWMIPYLTVRDADASLAFYEAAFGFIPGNTMPGPDGKTAHAEMRYHDAQIMFSPQGQPGNAMRTPADSGVAEPINLYVYTPDVNRLTERARGAGAKVVSEPADMFWGDRIATFEDADGYRWTFATNFGPVDLSKAPGGKPTV